MPLVAEDVQAQKAQWRQALVARLRQQRPEERRRRSQQITQQVVTSERFRQARTVAAYASLDEEVDTSAIIDAALAQGKRVALPRVEPMTKRLLLYTIRDRMTDTDVGPYGVRQPRLDAGVEVAAADIDVLLVPGVGFDRAGHRLGHGQGYYDRFLKTLPPTTVRMGLAFACQVVEQLPVEPHDATVTTLVSA